MLPRRPLVPLVVAAVAVFAINARAQMKLNPIQQRLVSGFASHEMEKAQISSPTRLGFFNPSTTLSGFLSSSSNNSAGLSYFPTSTNGCKENLGSNVKVNQNCLNVSDSNLQGRGQAQNETAIAVDPADGSRVVASFNDYRRGDGNCYAAYSFNGGAIWQDSTVPMGFTRGTAFGAARQYWQAGGDTSLGFDSRSNVYLTCQMFMRGDFGLTTNPDQSSAVYVFRSTQNNGASWNFPGRPVVQLNDVAGTGAGLEDKPYMTVDNNASSPFRDRVYVTWTEFLSDGSAYIWESYSADYGQTFSSRVLVSGNNPALCQNTFGAGTAQGNCNENQFSDPFVGPDGALYVVFANFNNAVTGSDNRNQILLAKSTDGGATFSTPVKVADYYDLPDCYTYQGGQDAGRSCVPEKGSNENSVFRATNYPVGVVNAGNANQVIVTVGSYINQNSQEPNCAPAGLSPFFGTNLFTGVKTVPGCFNNILVSVSNDGGATFTGTTTDPRSLPTAGSGFGNKWWQWAAFSSGKLLVSYYDRAYGSDEYNGNMDMTLSKSADLSSFTMKRVTSSSMPLPTQFPNGLGNGTFFGDYSGLAASGGFAHPAWMDTRDVDVFICPGTAAPGVPPQLCTAVAPNGLTANDQDIFTAAVSVFSF